MEAATKNKDKDEHEIQNQDGRPEESQVKKSQLLACSYPHTCTCAP